MSRAVSSTAIALLLLAVVACGQQPLPTAPTSQASVVSASQTNLKGGHQGGPVSDAVTHEDHRVRDHDNAIWVVGATVTATWDTGSFTDVAADPYARVTLEIPKAATTYTLDITASGYCPYHEDNRPVDLSGGWTYLFIQAGC